MQFQNLFPLRTDADKVTYALYVSLGCFFLGIAAIIWPILKNNGFPLDDAWIHQVVGRNTATFGIPGFIPGVASSGSTSAIWPWVIASNYRFASFVNPVVYLMFLNIICLSLILIVIFNGAARDRLPPLEIGLLVAFPMITGNFVWLISSGMEHMLFIASIFLASHFWFLNQSTQTSIPSILSGICCGLAILTRPEAIAFLPLFIATAWFLRKSRYEIAFFIVPCLISITCLLLNNFWTSHSVLPVTFNGRKWLYFGETPEPPILLALGLVNQWALRVLAFFIGIDVDRVPHVRLIELMVFTSMLLGTLRLIRSKAFNILFLLLLAVVNFATYCVIMPSPGHAGRYQAMAMVFIFPLIALGAVELVERITALLKTSPIVYYRCNTVAVVAIGVLALFSLSRWSNITEIGIRHINNTHVKMGQWLATNLTAGTPVAAFDIGGIGYFGNVGIVDLGGLTDPNFVPYLYTRRSAAYLKERDIRWVVLPINAAEVGSAYNDSCGDLVKRLELCDSTKMTKREVVSFYSPYELWRPGVSATEHANQGQVLYEINWR